MSKTFRRYEPDQMLLMPVALQEWLPADHLAYFISDVVDQLDLGWGRSGAGMSRRSEAILPIIR